MQTPTILLSVALVTRNGPDRLERCLRSVRSQSVQPYEIVVSDDSTPEFARQTKQTAERYECRYVEGPRRGLYANRNAAALSCRGTHIRTMDDDHLLPEGHFALCIEAVASDPEAIWTTGELGLVDGQYDGRTEVAHQLHPSGLAIPPDDPDNNWAIADGSTIYPASVFARGFRMVEDFSYGSSYLEFGAFLVHHGYHCRSIKGAIIEHHYKTAPANRHRVFNKQLSASHLYASLAYNLFFKRNLFKACRYTLSHLWHVRFNPAIVLQIPTLYARVARRWRNPPVESTTVPPLKVISINCDMMGHITYQAVLEATFRDHFPQVRFQSIHLFNRIRHNPVLRLLMRLARIRLPGFANSDLDFLRLRFECGMSLNASLILAYQIRKTGCDVVHLHTQSIAFLAPLLLKNLPYVVSLDLTTALLSRDRPFHPRHTLAPIIALEKRCLQHATHVISWSDRVRRSIIDDYGIPPEKVTIIAPASPIPEDWQVPLRHKRKGERIRLLFVGNDFQRKGGDEVVAVFKRDFADTCDLHVVSNGKFDLGTHPHLFVHRGVTPVPDQLLDQYTLADIFVMPTHEDCFPMVFVEAMASGLPCIGSTVMGIPDIVIHGVTGLNVPSGDIEALSSAIGQLVNDPALRSAMGNAGRCRAAEQFDSFKNCRRFLDILEASAKR